MLYTVWWQTRGHSEGISSLANTATDALVKIRFNRTAAKDAWALNDSGSEISEAELTQRSIAERL